MMRLHLSTLTARWPADTMPAMAAYESRTRRFSRAEYERLIDLGVFESGEEIELIGGQLMVAEPQSAAHYTAIVKTARALEAAFGARWYVRREGPIGLDDDSEPAPDAAAPFGWRYTRGEVLGADARVTPLAAPGASVAVSQLLP